MLVPTTVTLAAPVPAALPLVTTLVSSRSPVKPRVTLETSPPTLTPTRLLPLLATASWHRIDVSDSQLDRSQAVTPTRDTAHTSPSPTPLTVTTVDPVVAVFALHSTLITAGLVENVLLLLPRLTPLDKIRWRLPGALRPTRHRVDVSDSHELCSHALLPSTTTDVGDHDASPDPCTVTLADPVAAMFMRRIALKLTAPTENPCVMLHTRRPEVTAALLVRAPPPSARHRADESDAHAVASQAVRPSTADAEYHEAPIPAP